MGIAQIAPTLSAPLCLGSHGEDVKELQRQLNEGRSGPMLNADGRFGKLTHKAVVEFQRRNGVKADGVVGPVTAKLLGWGFGLYSPRRAFRRERPWPLTATSSQTTSRSA